MDTQRLKTVVEELLAEYEELEISTKLQAIETGYQRYVNQATALNGEAAKTSIDALYADLDNCRSNRFSPSMYGIFESIGGVDKAGAGLRRRIGHAGEAGHGIPANVFSQIQQIRKDVTEFFAGLTDLSVRLSALGIEGQKLTDDEAEVGVIFPDLVFTDDLDSLQDELKEMDFALGTLSELFEEGTASIKVRSISQGSPLEFFLAVSPKLAEVVSKAIKEIIGIYKSVQELRITSQQLENLLKQGKLLDAETDLKHAETSLKAAERKLVEGKLSALRDNLVALSKLKDEGRKNELKTQTYHALVYIANRIDGGVDWEAVAAIKKTVVTTAEPAEGTPEEIETLESVALRKLGEENAQALRSLGRSPDTVFNLAEKVEAEDFVKAVDETSKKRKKKDRKKRKS